MLFGMYVCTHEEDIHIVCGRIGTRKRMEKHGGFRAFALSRNFWVGSSWELEHKDSGSELIKGHICNLFTRHLRHFLILVSYSSFWDLLLLCGMESRSG